MEVGQRVKSLRGPLTQAEFSQEIGVTQGYLSSMEHGQKEIGAEILLALSEQCDISIEWILTGRKE